MKRGLQPGRKILKNFKYMRKVLFQTVLSHTQLQALTERQLSNIKLQQELALVSLMTIIESLKYLVRQGLTIRGQFSRKQYNC